VSIDAAADSSDSRPCERADLSVGDAACPTQRHDWVILDRVMCCYSDVERLMANALPAASRIFAFTVPTSRGWRGVVNRLAAARAHGTSSGAGHVELRSRSGLDRATPRECRVPTSPSTTPGFVVHGGLRAGRSVRTSSRTVFAVEIRPTRIDVSRAVMAARGHPGSSSGGWEEDVPCPTRACTRLGGVFAIAAVIDHFSDAVVEAISGQGSDNAALGAAPRSWLGCRA
jgi:hypothetical protein